MPVATNNGPPAIIEIGNTYVFQDQFPAYPVATWTMAFAYNNSSSGIGGSVAATISGANFIVTLTTAITNTLAIGRFFWAEYLTETSSGQRVTGNTGFFQVVPDLTITASATTAGKMLTALEAAITTLTAGTNLSVNFQGQTFTKKDLGQLLKARVHLQAEVLRELKFAAQYRGQKTDGLISSRFVPGQDQSPFWSKILGQT